MLSEPEKNRAVNLMNALGIIFRVKDEHHVETQIGNAYFFSIAIDEHKFYFYDSLINYLKITRGN